MAGSQHEEDVSPKTRSPEPNVLSRPPKLNGAHSSHHRTYSPLRNEHKPHGSSEIAEGTNGGLKKPAPTEMSPKSLGSPESSEFPFNAPPGTLGESPTNELISHHGETSNVLAPTVTAQVDLATEMSPSQAVSRRPTNDAEFATPTGRRSVQFARSATFESTAPATAQASHSRRGSIESEGGETPAMVRQSSRLMSKLKALANPSHTRNISNWTTGGVSAMDGEAHSNPLSPPNSERGEYRSDPREFYSDADADAEESAAEGVTDGPSSVKKRKRPRRIPADRSQTAPSTPRAQQRPNMHSRRATMTDIGESGRLGVSEDEGRDRMATIRKKSAALLHGHRGGSEGRSRQHDGESSPDVKRPSNFRRLTHFGGSEASPSTWRQRAEHTSMATSAKWRQLRNLMSIGQRKRAADNQGDIAKSAELMAELLAGAPAALIFASMIQTDEKGNKRTPVLLEQLKIRIEDSYEIEAKGDAERHLIFRIVLEYGSGMNRMKWVINRSVRDFTTLHVNYKLHLQAQKYKNFGRDDSKRVKFPKFPRSVFPYARALRGLLDEDEGEDEEEILPGEASGRDGEASGTDRPGKGNRRRSSFNPSRRKSSVTSPNPLGAISEMARGDSTLNSSALTAGARTVAYRNRQRKKLEHYLHLMIAYFKFRPDANRLCRFLELSAMGVRLATEGGYHGKEGPLTIRSSKVIDYRKAWQPTLFKSRHKSKWFVVRENCIIIMTAAHDVQIYDVFFIDSFFKMEKISEKPKRQESAKALAKRAKNTAVHPNHHSLMIANATQTFKLLGKTERLVNQFAESIRFTASNTPWSKPHRFQSYAPVRQNVFAQWLVDGRDYMWNVSRAIDMAQNTIFIQDWWLSPELYMRRPAGGSKRWRLDNLLLRKAREGVKIFVIVYRNINSAIPIDSEHTKHVLLDLHPNIFVQRSPNQLRQGALYWAHHEKFCIIDQTTVFYGGIDLCFGRWDTPGHVLTDDKAKGWEPEYQGPRDAEHCQLWPGKDYSNPRVQDFEHLFLPFEDMYERTEVPRMPWHDVGMQMVGHPARDLARHFVQRWNYILRQRNPTRPTPYLLPPPDFRAGDLELLGLDGTCEVQVLRSACEWSLGTRGIVEHSIQNAYIKSIETSEHFVYIENQFFITSCNVDGSKIENKIGDALVERILRADRNREEWRCIIIIPLMPGFESEVHTADGGSVRLIMQCQYRSICRGETSIFGRLQAAGIDPEDYIEFYALRKWDTIGPKKALVTEQLYIHAKIMIVDDRIAIIGSANINERSMLGSRDSEVAAFIRDREMIPSVMAGEPYRVSKFAHTLRMRLMREHLGIDVDEIAERERAADDEFDGNSVSGTSIQPDKEVEERLIESRYQAQDKLLSALPTLKQGSELESSNPNLRTSKSPSTDNKGDSSEAPKPEVEEKRPDHMHDLEEQPEEWQASDSIMENRRHGLHRRAASEGGDLGDISFNPKAAQRALSPSAEWEDDDGVSDLFMPPRPQRMDTAGLGLPYLSSLPALPVGDDTDIGGPPLQRTFSKIQDPAIAALANPVVTEDCMQDPLNDSFYHGTWHKIAENNTKLYRQVFRCMPDNDVHSWKEYHQYLIFSQRFKKAQGLSVDLKKKGDDHRTTGPPGHGVFTGVAHVSDVLGVAAGKILEKTPVSALDGLDPPSRGTGDTSVLDEKVSLKAEAEASAGASSTTARPESSTPDAAGNSTSVANASANGSPNPNAANGDLGRERTITISEPSPPTTNPEETTPPSGASPGVGSLNRKSSRQRRRRGTTRSSAKTFNAYDDHAIMEREVALETLGLVQGNLVLFPYNWLAREERNGSWLWGVDSLAPLDIYT
ncbi:phospholipase D [Aulographum hederae CBS 113979]|uniref:Phospholipase n=1 Tax=Aulographum hederae CBS 113979 TaxID=1176131 RepID=A0A6G1GRC6_9PEZI|nr:phospholipase D [Aulographum hederae CBS 113979]